MVLLLTFCLFFLGGCQKYHAWHLSFLPNSIKEHDLAKLSYQTTSYRGIAITIIRLKDHIDAYLEVQAFEIPPFHSDLHLAKVTFFAGDTHEVFLLKRLQGGQRLHFTLEALEKFLSLLHSYQEIKIETGLFSEMIVSDNFPYLFEKLKKQNSFFPKKELITFEFY